LHKRVFFLKAGQGVWCEGVYSCHSSLLPALFKYTYVGVIDDEVTITRLALSFLSISMEQIYHDRTKLAGWAAPLWTHAGVKLDQMVTSHRNQKAGGGGVACLTTGFGLRKIVSRRTGSLRRVSLNIIAEWSVAYGAFKK
jgi:hypothetical protein